MNRDVLIGAHFKANSLSASLFRNRYELQFLNPITLGIMSYPNCHSTWQPEHHATERSDGPTWQVPSHS